MKNEKEIPIYRNEVLTDVILLELILKPPNNSILHVQGDARCFKIGDRIKIGTDSLIFCGRVAGRDDVSGTILSVIEIIFLSDFS